jgi:hypothetical protein
MEMVVDISRLDQKQAENRMAAIRAVASALDGLTMRFGHIRKVGISPVRQQLVTSQEFRKAHLLTRLGQKMLPASRGSIRA